MQKAVILIAEDDVTLSQGLKKLLLRQGYEIIEASNRANLLQEVRTGKPDLVILGSWTKSAREGLEAAQDIRGRDKRIPLILLATNSCEDLAIAALRAGINDYFRKPFSAEEIAASVERCLAKLPPAQPSPNAATTAFHLIPNGRVISRSPSMQALESYLLKAATTDSTILITGETGTGKELMAELIHSNSSRRKKPFVCVNCAALPDSLLESELFGYERGAFTGAVARQRGKFELADNGTIFLDEIGEMNLSAQAKMLRTIENKQIYRLGGDRSLSFDIRIIAATNQDPEELVAEEKFRKDLYFRLNMVRIHLPPLRERKDDIPHLLNHFLREMNLRFGRSVEGFTEETLAYLLRYDWPGNVRELRNLCEAIFINQPSQMITFHDLPSPFQRLLRNSDGLSQSEHDRLLSALLSTKWNVSQAARKLHWSRMTIYRKIEKYHIIKPCPLEGRHEASLPGQNIVTTSSLK